MKKLLLVITLATSGCMILGTGAGAGIGYVADGREGKNQGMYIGWTLGLLIDLALCAHRRRR